MAAIFHLPQASRPACTNRLLEALPRRERERVLAVCERVELNLAEVLWESDARIRYVYFPTDCFVSLTISGDGGTLLEAGLVGDEGKLQALGVIRYSRGSIVVLDRKKLEQLCCECYDVVKRETDRLLPHLERQDLR